MPEQDWQFELEEYIKQGEPDRTEKSEAQRRIHSYYEQRTTRTELESETKEADIVSARIAKLLGAKYELKNRYMHIDYTDGSASQSISAKIPKYQFDTFDCSLEELAILELVAADPTIKQQELVSATGKSIATIKRIMKSLQDKQYIRRESGKRYGKWEVLV